MYRRSDPKYREGSLTAKTRLIRIKNVLTDQTDTLDIPSEETIEEVRERYLDYNWHAKSYTWKSMRREQKEASLEWFDLDMTKVIHQYLCDT